MFLGGLIEVATVNKNGLQRAMLASIHFNIEGECYVRISVMRIYTSASFAISCYAGGRNLLDMICYGGASLSEPTCMRISGTNQLLLYYTKGTDIFIKPALSTNTWINISPLTSEFSMIGANLVQEALDTSGLKEFIYK